jgi:hypothetical protein
VARTSREIPKELAEFGQRQFNETGAQSVEVLRVKAAVIRKYWTKLKGIAFLVGVVSLDRVRVYFFASNGVMLVGENVEHDIYTKIRSKSKLVKKFEKPKPPTELELRMEATEELRSHLSKSIRRVARFLGEKEPDFPLIFVSKPEIESNDQSFAMRIEDDGAHIFEEESINSRLFEGLSVRSAFLSLLDTQKSQESISHCIGNAIASMLLKDPHKTNWNEYLIEYNKTSELQEIAVHLLKHLDTYGSDGFAKILDLLRITPKNSPLSQWLAALSIIHSHHEVSLGTDAWHIIDGFCKSLEKPRKLAMRRHILESVHLSPRILCNTVPLGFSLGVDLSPSESSSTPGWMRVNYRDGSQVQTVQVTDKSDNPIVSVEYHLQLDDVIPKSGGIQSRGRQILRWAAKSFGIDEFKGEGFTTSIDFEDKPISESERAVLERLSLGQLDILSNTLIGSPQRIESLINSGCITLVPDFNHLGIVPNFIVEGDLDSVNNLSTETSLESTIINTESTAYGILSAPAVWEKQLLETASTSLKIFPIVSTSSPRGLIREEVPFGAKTISSWNN